MAGALDRCEPGTVAGPLLGLGSGRARPTAATLCRSPPTCADSVSSRRHRTGPFAACPFGSPGFGPAGWMIRLLRIMTIDGCQDAAAACARDLDVSGAGSSMSRTACCHGCASVGAARGSDPCLRLALCPCVDVPVRRAAPDGRWRRDLTGAWQGSSPATVLSACSPARFSSKGPPGSHPKESPSMNVIAPADVIVGVDTHKARPRRHRP